MKENQRITVTKRMLREGLLRLLKTKNLDKIHINELCEESGINRATFYRHYKSPQDVLMELELEFVKQVAPLTRRPQNVKEAEKQLENACAYVYDHADIAKILFRCSTVEGLMRGINEFYCQFLELWKKESQFAPLDESVARIVIALLGGGGYCLLRQWILDDIPKTPQEIAAILCNVLRWPVPLDFLLAEDK